MAEKISLEPFPMNRALKQLGSKYAFYYDTIAGFSVAAITTNLVNDYAVGSGSLVDWLIISFTGYVAAALVFLLGRAIFFQRKRISGWAVVGVFLLAGLARGVVIYALGIWFGQISQTELSYRIVGSTLYTFFMLGLISVLVSNGSRSAKKLDELESQIVLLQESLIGLREQLATQKAELIGRVKSLVYPMVQDLIAKVDSSRASGSVVEAVSSLKTAVDDELRPLSLSLSNDNQGFVLTQLRPTKSRFRLFTRVTEPIEVSSLFSPTWMAVLMVLFAGPTATHVFGASGTMQLLVGAMTVFLGLHLAAYLLRGRWLSQELSFLTVMVACALIGLVADLAVSFSPLNSVDYRPGRLVAFMVILGLVFFIGQLYQFQRDIAERQLVEINDRLEKLTASARRELWVYRKKVATVLHGPVQARLYASAIRLTQAKRITKPLIDRVSRELGEAMAELDFEQIPRESMRQVMRQIIDVWSGNCEIFAAISKDVYLLAKKNPDFADAYVEVMREAVSNAVKHSKATEIEIESSISGDMVSMQITNNGSLPDKNISRGYGSRLYDELTYSWSLSSAQDGKTKFEAKLVAN
jgi:signal transduction histidine kinase